MNTKKIVGIVVATLLVLITGISGVSSAITLQKGYFSTEGLLDDINIYSEDVALIYIVGTIQDTGEDVNTIINDGYRHQPTVTQIEELADSESNKGIMLYLDTPGGGVLESDEVYLALMEYKETTGRPVYAYMHGMAASGGYYISCAADTVIANRNCLTGSLGVIMGYTDYSGLYEKLGIESHEYVSGPFKSIASPENSDEEDAIYQSFVDEAYDQFVDIIMQARNLSDSEVRKLADGRIYTANQALEHNLIDTVGDFDDALNLVAEETGYGVNHYPLATDLSFFDTIFATVSDIMPRSDSQVLLKLVEDQKPVELYYVLQD